MSTQDIQGVRNEQDDPHKVYQMIIGVIGDGLASEFLRLCQAFFRRLPVSSEATYDESEDGRRGLASLERYIRERILQLQPLLAIAKNYQQYLHDKEAIKAQLRPRQPG